MRSTKGNDSFIKVLKRTALYGLWNMWKQDVGWDRKTRKEKNLCIWFSLSLFCMIVLCETPLFLVTIMNFCLSCICLERFNIK